MTASGVVSVGIWTRGGGVALEQQLAALRTQKADFEWSVTAIDVEAPGEGRAQLGAAARDFPVPLHVSELYAEEFDRGDVRNWLAIRAEGDVLVFLEPSARPASDGWLAALVASVCAETVGAAYSAELPNVGAVALRRAVWERHPFQRSRGGVDGSTARALSAAGFELAHPEGAGVVWSQDRATVEEDGAATTRLLSGEPLRLLYVVHGFPPDTWAGTEVYTLELAREMQQLGHSVTVLTRTDGDRPVDEGGAPEFSIREDAFEDLRVLRMTRRLAVDSIRQTYEDPRAVVAFREVLLRERPDVVHFQHLIHSSAALVEVASGFGLPTIVHCHDYWAICPRVQLIRPDGGLCDDNRGAGCYLCVHEKAISQIPRLEGLGSTAPERLTALVEEERAQRDVFRRARTARGERWQGLGDLLDRRDVVPQAYAAADLRVSPSRFLRRTMIAAGGFDADTFLFSDNGLRTERVHALEKQRAAGRLRLGFVGSLVWYKGCEVLVRALAQLSDLPIELGFHGDFKPEEDPFHARLRDLATEQVTFHGRFDNTRLSEVYAEIDVLIVPSVWYENSPITIHEAFLTRTPVVTSGVGGMAEFVRDGVDGLHFQVGDADDLARVLRRFVDEPDLLSALSQDWIPIKDIAENARENEFRYRQLACIERPRRPILFYDHRGTDTVQRNGEVEEQGPGTLLLRPGTSVEYDVELAAGGEREVRLELVAFDAEPKLSLAARALVAGGEGARTVARTGAFRAADGRGEPVEVAAGVAGRVLSVSLLVPLEPAGAGPLRLRIEPDGSRACVRLRRVSVLERPPQIRSQSRWARTLSRARGWLRWRLQGNRGIGEKSRSGAGRP